MIFRKTGSHPRITSEGMFFRIMRELLISCFRIPLVRFLFSPLFLPLATGRKKGGGTPKDAVHQPPHSAECGARPFGTRTPSGVPPRLSPRVLSFPRLGVRPGYLGRGRSARSVMLAPTGGRRPRAILRALPGAACPSPVSTSRAGRSAGGHDARAAREQTVSFHPRAPHSLRFPEYLRERRPSPSEICAALRSNTRCQAWSRNARCDGHVSS
jgi:hypothetical protein